MMSVIILLSSDTYYATFNTRWQPQSPLRRSRLIHMISVPKAAYGMCDPPIQRVVKFPYTLLCLCSPLAGKLYKRIDRWPPHRINATSHIFFMSSYKLRILSSRNAPHSVTTANLCICCYVVYIKSGQAVV